MSEPENDDTMTTAKAEDLIGFVRCVAPQPEEPAETFAKRLLHRILRSRPAGCIYVHIVADRYDVHGDSGISLKDASGCHTRLTN